MEMHEDLTVLTEFFKTKLMAKVLTQKIIPDIQHLLETLTLPQSDTAWL